MSFIVVAFSFVFVFAFAFFFGKEEDIARSQVWLCLLCRRKEELGVRSLGVRRKELGGLPGARLCCIFTLSAKDLFVQPWLCLLYTSDAADE